MSETQAKTGNNRFLKWLPVIIFSVICIIELITILIKNQGHFGYTLDDAYIHLALAENIVKGHYGVNFGEYSAPASSIIWPIIIAPFARMSLGYYFPLLINFLASIGTIIIFQIILERIFDFFNHSRKPVLMSFMVIALIFVANLVGLVFNGMEHSLQVFITALLLLGVIHEIKTRKVALYLLIALVLGSLIRYENLALSMPVLIHLVRRNHVKPFFICGSLIVLSLVGFSIFLSSKGLGFFPSSVVVKSDPVALGGSAVSLIGNFLRNICFYRQGTLTLLIFLLLIYTSFNSRLGLKDRKLSLIIAISVFLHLLIGKFGEYHRYEIYIWTSSFIMILYFYRTNVVNMLQVRSSAFVAVILAVFISLTCTPYIWTIFTTPQASHNIHAQHHQMNRFITEYFPTNVAVNDIGWVSYRNDNYVLDLWGLASKEALGYRMKKTNPDWMDKLASKHNVKFAMVYSMWFPVVPDNWIPLGVLYLDEKRITPSCHDVIFYALDVQTRDTAIPLLKEYQKTLPKGATFTFEENYDID